MLNNIKIFSYYRKTKLTLLNLRLLPVCFGFIIHGSNHKRVPECFYRRLNGNHGSKPYKAISTISMVEMIPHLDLDKDSSDNMNGQ